MTFRPMPAAGLLALAVALLHAPAAPAAGPAEAFAALAPHRAVYDLALADAGSGAGITAAEGRLVFEFGGSPCEGFTVASRFVTRLTNLDGASRLTDLRSATYETVEEPSYTFRHRTFVNEIEQDPIAGRATIDGDEVMVDLEEPEEGLLRIEGPAVFPTRQVAELLAAAAAGERIHETAVFDGSDTGVKVYATTAVIGPERAGVGAAGEDLGAALEPLAALDGPLRHWRVNLSYFDLEGASGEVLPSYELAFLLYDNGISRDITFDYGEFSLDARLVELEIGEQTPCE